MEEDMVQDGSGVENGQGDAPSVTEEGQLSYIGRDCTRVPAHFSETYGSKVRRLDLSYNLLRDLHGVDSFPALEELILDSNNLQDHFYFPAIPNLHTLTMNKNNITDLEWLLDTLSVATPKLSYLSLLGNEACPNQLSSTDKDEDDYQRYRYYVLHRFPNLKFLDSSAVLKSERLEAERQGAFLRVIRPTTPERVSRSPEEESSSSPYTPLSPAVKATDQTKATFGKCHYVYYGRHSEGNRFIRNNDL